MAFEIIIKFRVVVHETFSEVSKLLSHGDAVEHEVGAEPRHERAEADVGVRLVAHRHQ